MSRALNLLWLNLDLPALPDPEDGSLREPMPADYIAKARKAAESNPDTEVRLWIDSKRLTERQRTLLHERLEEGLGNISLQDLRAIPAYHKEPLFNKKETSESWRADKNSLIWRQVDAAKLLVSLEGDFDQSFFADLDLSHIQTNAPDVQGKLEKYGLFVGVGSGVIENQIWGLDRSRKDFFQSLYEATLKDAAGRKNGWDTLLRHVDALTAREKLGRYDFCIFLRPDGSQAHHPGHKWCEGKTRKIKAFHKLGKMKSLSP
jgi:hypothetical protein